MTRISSKSTWFWKWAFPVGLVGFVATFYVVLMLGKDAFRNPAMLAMPSIILALGLLSMKKHLWGLADEVRDGGDYLLVRKRGREIRVPMSGIINVNMASHPNPARITLRLDSPSAFGDEIAFLPETKFSIGPKARNPVAEDLIVRVDRARATRTAR